MSAVNTIIALQLNVLARSVTYVSVGLLKEPSPRVVRRHQADGDHLTVDRPDLPGLSAIRCCCEPRLARNCSIPHVRERLRRSSSDYHEQAIVKADVVREYCPVSRQLAGSDQPSTSEGRQLVVVRRAVDDVPGCVQKIALVQRICLSALACPPTLTTPADRNSNHGCVLSTYVRTNVTPMNVQLMNSALFPRGSDVPERHVLM